MVLRRRRQPRAPVLAPSALGWLGLPAAREMRVAVSDDGSLVLSRPGGAEQRLAGPGEITRAVHVPPESGVPAPRSAPRRSRYRIGLAGRDFWPPAGVGAVVFAAGDRPVATLHVQEWWPGTGGGADLATSLDLTGLTAVAEALGTTITDADQADLAWISAHSHDIEATIVSPLPRSPRWLTWVLGAAIAGWAGSFIVLLTRIGRDAGTVLPVMLTVAVVTSAVGVAGYLGLERRAARLSRQSPRGEPTIVATSRHSENARPESLSVAADWIVVRDAYGREAWLPGRDLGGITRVDVNEDGLLLADDRGTVWTGLPGSDWFAEPAHAEHARQRARAAGYDVGDRPDLEAHDYAVMSSIPPVDEWVPTVARNEATGLPRISPGRVAAVAAVPAVASMVGWWDEPAVSVPAGAALAAIGFGILRALVSAIRS